LIFPIRLNKYCTSEKFISVVKGLDVMSDDFEVIRDVKEDDSVYSLEEEDDEDTKEVIRSYIG
jgi:hypothetical protein